MCAASWGVRGSAFAFRESLAWFEFLSLGGVSRAFLGGALNSGIASTMAACLLHLLEALLLVLNAAAILNPDRFLKRLQLHSVHSAVHSSGGEPGGVRMQVALFLFSIRTYLKLPLVVANCVFILFEMLLG